MGSIDKQDFIEFVKTLEGQVLQTLKQKKNFTVCVTDVALEYTPQSTMKVRRHRAKPMERIFCKFNETGSYKTADYKGLTTCASYTLKLIAVYLAPKRKLKSDIKRA
jgi:hypothetical protein